MADANAGAAQIELPKSPRKLEAELSSFDKQQRQKAMWVEQAMCEARRMGGK